MNMTTTDDKTIDQLIASLDDHRNPARRDESRMKLMHWLEDPDGLKPEQRVRIKFALSQ
ncbi:hypothetical protein QT231_22685 [Halomonas sp. SpR1]|uniref:hypothetical protein n=1 Tax=Halomonas sp. SpR1 TaxID=3050462 RepID=UPI0027E3DE3A|nr:hypothetical protein [Halomonas sp. SpR1]MDQ7735516.1 hypothetical protein [Halomonas sp. SpR1]